jgi:hypothetical protein
VRGSVTEKSASKNHERREWKARHKALVARGGVEWGNEGLMADGFTGTENMTIMIKILQITIPASDEY